MWNPATGLSTRSRAARGESAHPILVVAAILFLGIFVGQEVFRGEDVSSRVLLFLGAIAVCAAPLLFRSWRYTFVACVVYMVFSGFLNHLTNYHKVTRAMKFALVGVVLAHWFVSEVLPRWREGERMRYPLVFPLAIFALLSVVEMFNPLWSSTRSGLKAGVGGLMMHVMPMGLLFVGFDFVTERRQITAFVVLVVCLTTLMGAFGIYQHFVGIQGIAGWGSSFGETVHRELAWGQNFKQVMKPISFANDAGAASSFYTIGLLFALLLFLRADLKPRHRGWLASAFLLLAISLFLTQVRLAFVGATTSLLVFALFGYRGKSLFLLLLLGVGFLVSYFLYDPGVRSVLVDRYGIFRSPFDAAVEHRGTQAAMILVMMRQYPYGAGIGRAGPGAYLGASHEDLVIGISPGENYYANLVYETGLLGFALILLVFVRILQRVWVLYFHELDDPVDRVYCLAAGCMLGVIMLSGMGGPVLYSTPMNVFFWFVTGILFKLPDLDRSPAAAPAVVVAGRPAPVRRRAPGAWSPSGT